MKKFFSLLGLLIFLATLVQAQTGKVSGKIVQGDNGSPVPNATVTIKDMFKMKTVTDQNGQFEINWVPFGKHTLSVTHGDFEVMETEFEVKGATAVIPDMILKHKADNQEGVSELSTITLDMEDENKDQNVSGLLHSSEDVFTSTAGYTFGSMYFRPRGYDSENRGVRINGNDVSDAENGRVSFNDWGGLNDAMRNKTVFNYMAANPFTFGNIGGITNIDTRASNYRKQIKVSYSLTNRTYRNRAMLTYATGLMKNGWAFTLSGSRRWSEEGYAEGTFYDAWGYFLAAEKRFGKHSLSLTVFGAPMKRGQQSASVQEAYDLAGTNYYNPNWGYQDGKKRNAKVRSNNEPYFILSHTWNISEKTSLATSLNYSFGKTGWTSLNWYNAQDPRPDYYRYLPSYQILRDRVTMYDTLQAQELANLVAGQFKNDVNVRQINWDRLIQINKMSAMEGKQARYIVENNITKTTQFLFNTVLKHEFNQHFTFNGGLNLRYYDGEHYKVLDDLLGATYWVDIDQFNERDFRGDSLSAQNNLLDPNRVIGEGDKFGYNYVAHNRNGNLWGQITASSSKIDAYLAVSFTETQMWRTGKYKNGRHPDNSYGDSKKYSFFDPAVKAGITGKITGRHYIDVTGFYMTRAPFFTNSFVSPKTRDDVVPDLSSEKIYGFDASYIVRYPWLNARLSYYYTGFSNCTEITSFYHDYYNTYMNYIMYDISKRHQGIEFGAEAKVTKRLSLIGVAAVGQYIYTNRPMIKITYDNGSLADMSTIAYLKNFYVPSTPQTALSAGLKYNIKYWYLDIDGSWYDNGWLDFNPERRTDLAVANLAPGNPLIESITTQRKLKEGFSLDVSLGKSIRIAYKYFININLSVTNVLDNKNLQNGGFEQNRFDFDTRVVEKFEPKYYYYYGRTFFLNLSFRM
ncbi:MAG TPA: TonB-dependent receptor [Bacteroidales bacterium]|nr:TonB-dependent receptor [Bacteroidales bacterium]